MLVAVVIFVIGSSIQAGAVSIGMLFVGRAITGLPIGQLTMVVPQYMSEVSVPRIRGTLVVLQQLSITLGILVSYWLEYGTHYIGGTRCDPSIPYTGGKPGDRTFDPYTDVGPNGCTGQTNASWRVPFALQIFPALILGIGMIFYPESPRWWLMTGKEERAFQSLARIRRVPTDDERLGHEFLAIKADVMFEDTIIKERFHGWSGARLFVAQYADLISSWPNFRRLIIGSAVMFFQQFMGCNAMIYYGQFCLHLIRKKLKLLMCNSSHHLFSTWTFWKYYLLTSQYVVNTFPLTKKLTMGLSRGLWNCKHFEYSPSSFSHRQSRQKAPPYVRRHWYIRLACHRRWNHWGLFRPPSP